jgi:hypothetical protein
MDSIVADPYLSHALFEEWSTDKTMKGFKKIALSPVAHSLEPIIHSKDTVEDLYMSYMHSADSEVLSAFLSDNTVLKTLRLWNSPNAKDWEVISRSNVSELEVIYPLDRTEYLMQLNYFISQCNTLKKLHLHIFSVYELQFYLSGLEFSESIEELVLNLGIRELSVSVFLTTMKLIEAKKPNIRINGFDVKTAVLELLNADELLGETLDVCPWDVRNFYYSESV